MRTSLVILAISISMLAGCKSKQKATGTTITTAAENVVTTPKTIGKVSHKYRATGCETVVIVILPNEEKPLTLIPRVKLSSQLDVDGLEISFNYRLLKMPQPAGCYTGIPAELTEIVKN
jgi:hypothetical protein